MADLEYTVTNQGIATTKTSRLVSGTIGVYTVKFTFNNVWDGLEKWATFDPIPGTPYKQPLDANGECTIPGEVMGGVYLRIGVFGLAEGQAYPTIWASKLPLEEGCFVNVPPSDWPEPSPLLEDVVKVSEQTFTDAQKTQARTNIGAAGSADMATALAGKVDKPVGATEGNVAVIGSNSNIADSGKSLADIYDSAMIHKTASGAIVTIEDGADEVPIKEMTMLINPVQAGSDDPSPSNVRAISGFTEAVVSRRKNLINSYYYSTAQTINGITFTINSDKTITATGTATAEVKYTVINNSNPLPLVDLYFSGCPSGGGSSTYQLACSRQGGVGQTSDYGNGNVVTSEYSNNVRMQIIIKNGYAIPTNAPLVFKPMISFSPCHYDDFVSPYATGVNTSYTVNFPAEAGTVYGGNLVINEDGTGTLTVNWERGEYDGSSDESWTWNGSNTAYISTPNSVQDSALSDKLQRVPYSTGTGSMPANSMRNSSTILLLKAPSDKTSLALFRSWLSDMGGVTVVWKVSTPATYTLTAPQVKTLLGLNNVWADTGDIAVEYHADPTIFVEEKTRAIKKSIAYVQNDFTAVQQYLVNDLVYVGDTLYIVTSAIAQGATMTPNTNCAETTLNTVIKSLR